MKINKNLKFADFSYDEEEKVFTIVDKEGNSVALNKVYSFAFMRFVIRIAQRNWLRTKKIIDKPTGGVVDLPELNPEAIVDLQESLKFAEQEELKPVWSEDEIQRYDY